MTRIKICGIMNLEDARAAADCGADALGFIFVPESPRYVGGDDYFLDALNQLPPFVSRVAVCQEAGQIIGEQRCAFDTVQFYSSDWHRPRLPTIRYIAAVSLRDKSTLLSGLQAVRKVLPDAVLLDTYHETKLGGSGETFDWNLALEVKSKVNLPIILAGGLTPDNVGDAIAKVRPYAVDVSSGVEAQPGRKDHAKLKAFIQAVRRADAIIGD